MTHYCIPVAALNKFLQCPICEGYLRAAHTIPECMHTMCKSCLYKSFASSSEGTKGSSIACPVCKINLGTYTKANVNSKIIHDRNKQAVVDRIFPHFAAAEKEQEKQFDARNKAESESKKRASESNVDSSDSKHKQAKINSNSVPRSILHENADSKTGEEKSDEIESKFIVTVNPDRSCDESLQLPKVSKNVFNATMTLKFRKVKSFILKRLGNASELPVDFEDIHLSWDTTIEEQQEQQQQQQQQQPGEGLRSSDDFSTIEDEINAALNNGRQVKLLYKRRAAST